MSASTAAALVALVMLCGGFASAARAENETPCRVDVSITPERPVVGEAIRYSLVVTLGRGYGGVQWREEPSFPRLRSEWLPGRAGDREREERRVLFALEPGHYEITAGRFRCIRHDRREVADAVIVAVDPIRFEVHALPELAGRGASGFDPLVATQLRTKLSTSAQQVRLGDTFEVMLSVESDGNLWVQAEPQPSIQEASGSAGPGGHDGPSVEIFSEAPQSIERVIEGTSEAPLYFRRHWRWSIVPRTPGTLVIQPISLRYYHPRKQRPEHSTTGRIEVEVLPREPRDG